MAGSGNGRRSASARTRFATACAAAGRPSDRAAADIAAWTAGSFFRNPPEGPSAGELIDRAGLKGRRVGGASVSPKHANFLVNDGRGTAADIRRLGDEVRDEVERRFGVRLVTEVEFLGDWDLAA